MQYLPGRFLLNRCRRGLAVWAGMTCLRVQLPGAFLLAQVASLTRPLLMRTLLKRWRSPFVLDADLDHTMAGRAIGVVLGMLLGWGMAWQ